MKIVCNKMNPSSVKPRLELDEGESDDKYETASDE